MKNHQGDGRGCAILLLSIAAVVASSIFSSSAHNVNQSPDTSANPPTLGLVGYWSFDEGTGTRANDTSGNVNHGTLLNGPLWQADCKAGNCLRFDGVDDLVKVNNSASLQITGDITISIWIKPLAVSANQMLVHKSREFHLGHIETTAPYRIQWHHASLGAGGYVANSTNVGEWQHIVLVRNNTTKQVRGYKNGALEVTSSYTTGPTTSTNPVGIGSRYSGGDYFNGFIDEVRIYNRTLTEAEIAELYNLTPDTSPPSTPAGLTAVAGSSTHVNLSWNASTDNVAVTGYRVYRNGVEVGTSATTAYQDTGLSASTTYTYTVSAFDAAGNHSMQSSPASATTLPTDTNPPQISAVSSSSVSSSAATITWTTDEPADSQIEYGTSTAYGQATTINPSLVTSHTQTLSNLTASTTYHYRVKSRDGSGNLAVSADNIFTTASVAPQREDVVIASGITNPTSMAIAPDGRVFVAEQGGSLRVIKNNALLATPFLTVSVTSNNERGLLGVTFDPNFATNRYVYIYYTALNPVVNRLSRFRASSTNPDVAEAGSEVIIINDIPSQTGWHNGGAIHFGGDGKLYVAVGEGHSGSNAQSLTTLSGKLLRVDPSQYNPNNANAIIPTDNPFYNTTSGMNRSIWALGLRNPFTFDIQPTTGRIFINDVGEATWEEINEAWVGPNNGSNAGYNFAWPTCEGPQGSGVGNCSSPAFKYPFYAYLQGPGGTCAITGGAFYNPATVNFPSEYVGDYFFADYCAGWIKSIDLASGIVTDFIAGGTINDPVDIKVGSNGSMYYLARNGGSGVVRKVTYLNTNQPPMIITHPADQTVSVGQSASFAVGASGSAPLSYQWQRNGVDIAGATGASYTLTNAQAADSGAQFRVVVSNAYGSATSNFALLTVTANQTPTGTITQPAAGALYSGGETIAYAGSGNDPEDGALPPSAFTWRVDFHHETHVHPFIPDTAGSTSGSFTVPTTGHTAADVWYRIYLTVRDSAGTSHTSFRDVMPRTVSVTLATNPAGLQVTLDGQPRTTPVTFVGVVGMERVLGAPSPQVLNATSYQFGSWSDGGSQSHTIATPAANTTYTATYQAAAGCTSSISATSQYFGVSGGSGGVGVTAPSGCSWTATSNASWITITSSTGGTGNGAVNYLVRENSTGSARTGTLDIDGRTFTVMQDGGLGAACGYAISPTNSNFSGSGGVGSISVASDSRCAWQAVSNVSWITITSGGAGIGNGAVSYSVAANPGASGRRGTLTVAGKTFSVKQKQATGLASLALNPTTVASGNTSQGTVTLAEAAPAGGAVVTLSSNNTSVATVPTSVTVSSGATSATFTVATNSVSVSTSGTISASYGGTTRTSTLIVSPPLPGIGNLLPTRLPESVGTTFYVATTGSDSNPGTLASPWRTIQKALNTLQPGQKAYVRTGTYPEALRFDRAGTATNPITIEAYPGEAPIIDGGFVRRALDIGSAGAYLRVRGFIIERSAFESGGHIDVYGHHVEIVGNEIRNGKGKGVYTDESSHHVHIIANRIHHNATVPGTQQDHGIYLQGSDHFVANNVIHDHPDGFGIQVYDLNHRSIIVNNTITHSGHSGIVVGGSGGVDNITIRNNILAYNSRYGVQRDSTCPTANVLVDHNVIFSNSSGTVQTGCGAINTSGGNITSNPLFLDVANRDLRIASGSPAIGAVLFDYSMPNDFLGGARDSQPDIGAYEFSSGSLNPQAASLSFSGVVEIERALGAPSPQPLNGSTYQFVSWSAGDAPFHTIARPVSYTTYTATYQAAAGCTSSISATSQVFRMNGGSGSVGVLASGSCSWSATSNAGWITIASATGGVGNGGISYEVRENFTGSARTGTLDIDGRIFTVMQDGASGGAYDVGAYETSPTPLSPTEVAWRAIIGLETQSRLAVSQYYGEDRTKAFARYNRYEAGRGFELPMNRMRIIRLR